MNMAVYGIDHVQLSMAAGGEAPARRFYGEVLGLAEKSPSRRILLREAARGFTAVRCNSISRSSSSSDCAPEPG
jgi:hypothetical protein